MKLFDSHAHLYDKAFDDDREELIKRLQGNLACIMIPSENLETSRKAAALAEAHPFLYAAVGIHPHEAKTAGEGTLEALAELAKHHRKVKAIGEIGLDYYRMRSEKEAQRKWFALQLELAKSLDLPVIIHDREAHGDILALLKEHKSDRLRGVIHCFSGSAETARELMKLGFYISFAGPVVYRGSTRLRKAASEVPLDRMLIETDSPYLTPPPKQGQRNDPSNVFYVAEQIACIKGIPVSDVIERTARNAAAVYGIQL